MALYKRDGTWWVDIFHQGKRVRKSTGTEIKQDAEYFHAQLTHIDRDLIESIAKKKEQSNVSLTTVNRVLELIRAILNRAQKEWGWLEILPTIRMRKVENKRIHWLTKNEA